MDSVKLHFIQGDITELDVDAIVNAANTALRAGGGVSGAIHRAAGPELEAESSALGGCDYGEAKLTKGYDLPAAYVIHTVGPVYGQHEGQEPELLRNSYYQSLKLADEHNLRSIAFPLISTGAFGYPFGPATDIAKRAISEYFQEQKTSSLTDVYLVAFTEDDLALLRS